ncbi:MAG: QueT transporter family protein [Candidatus Abyssubacteria bacterium]
MREVVTMWKYTKMVVLVAVTAAFYAALVFMFKFLVIVPGLTEIRPGSVIPVVFGLLFGPAGAWGAAFGNVIGDFSGTLGPGSVGGFVGNFFYGLLGYKIWGHMGLASSEVDLAIDSRPKALNFILVSILSSLACADIIAWWLETIRIFPFVAFAPIVLINNLVFCLVIGIPLMRLLYGRLNKWDLVWFAIMDESDRSVARSPKIGTALIWVAVVGGFAVGIALSLWVGQAEFAPLAWVGVESPTPAPGSVTPSVALGVAPFLVLLVIGCLLV